MDYRIYTCPRCSDKFAALWIYHAREFPCPTCDAILTVVDREGVLRRMNACGMALLISFISYIVSCFILISSSRDEYLLIQRVFFVSAVALPVLFCSGFALNRVEKGVRFEVVGTRRSCKNCGYVMSVGNPSFCPKCGTQVRSGGYVFSSLGGNNGAPAVDQPCHGRGFIECMICGQVIKRFDESIQCPACGSTFHSAHMLEYLHTHGRCPACGRRLNDELVSLSSGASGHSPQEGEVIDLWCQ